MLHPGFWLKVQQVFVLMDCFYHQNGTRRGPFLLQRNIDSERRCLNTPHCIRGAVSAAWSW